MRRGSPYNVSDVNAFNLYSHSPTITTLADSPDSVNNLLAKAFAASLLSNVPTLTRNIVCPPLTAWEMVIFGYVPDSLATRLFAFASEPNAPICTVNTGPCGVTGTGGGGCCAAAAGAGAGRAAGGAVVAGATVAAGAGATGCAVGADTGAAGCAAGAAGGGTGCPNCNANARAYKSLYIPSALSISIACL